MNHRINEYLTSLLPPTDEWLKQIEGQAKAEYVPIMDKLAMNFLMQVIRIKKPNKILEIGTAIGYSALRMNEAFPNSKVITIEQDEQRTKRAVNNIKKHNKDKQIDVLHGDALEVMKHMQTNHEQFDLIFIDAAKSKYKQFFKQAVPLLLKDGIIVTDNVLFKGYVVNADNVHRRHRKLAEKIDTFNKWLANQANFVTTVIPIGDGVAISIKK